MRDFKQRRVQANDSDFLRTTLADFFWLAALVTSLLFSLQVSCLLLDGVLTEGQRWSVAHLLLTMLCRVLALASTQQNLQHTT